jgi:hypothetical protein
VAQDDKEAYFYNVGASDYSPLLFVVFFVIAVVVAGYFAVEIYQNTVH